MSIKYFANKVKETSITTSTNDFILNGAPSGWKTFVNAIGTNKKFTYYAYRVDTNFEWEIGIGYIISSGGSSQLVRETVVSSSNGNSLVGFTVGTKFIECIIGQDRANTSFINVDEKSSNFSPDYIPATYIVDASTTGVQVSLPSVIGRNDSVILGFMLSKTIGNSLQQSNAIYIVPSGSETINGGSSLAISLLNDYIQLVSVPSQTGWYKLDPLQDTITPYGNSGNIQFKYNNGFSGVNNFNWDASNNSMLIGGSGTIGSADIILPASSGQTVVFNEQSYANNFRVAGSGAPNLLFIDGLDNQIGINTSATVDSLTINSQSGAGITAYRSGVGPQLCLKNTAPSSGIIGSIIGSIVYSGLNTSGNPVEYAKIYAKVDSALNSYEKSSIKFNIINNGSSENIGILSSSGVTLGYNNTNSDGFIIGHSSNNDGNNILIGSSNTSYGEDTVLLGQYNTAQSGSQNSIILGRNNSGSGINLYILGGSGVNISGNNAIYLALNNNNNFALLGSGNLTYKTLSASNINFIIENSGIQPTGSSESLLFKFTNASSVSKTGLDIGLLINNNTNNAEETSLFANVSSSGSGIRVVNIGSNNIVIGNNLTSGNCIVYGSGNTTKNKDIIVGANNSTNTSGNNIVIGRLNTASVSSGTSGECVIVGHSNICGSSGNYQVIMMGHSNIADEDYAVAIGHSNNSSGLYSVGIGYANGAVGDYAVSLGSSNTVQSNGGVAIGRQNLISVGNNLSTACFALGIGNNIQVDESGIIFGYTNQLRGSGGLIVGSECSVSGADNVIIGLYNNISGTNNIVIGNNVNWTGSNSVVLGGTITDFVSSVGGFNFYGSGYAKISSSDGNYVSATNSGVYINGSGLIKLSSNNTSGNYISITNSGISISGNISSSSSINANSGIFSSISGTNAAINSGDFTHLRASYIKNNLSTNIGTILAANNWLPTATGDIIRVSGAAVTGVLTGISSSYPLDKFILINVGTGSGNGPIEIWHNNSSSSSGNRIYTPGGSTKTIAVSGGSVTIIRDTVDNIWRVL